ncbi:hypothetical protein [Evansella cellulosilytica]|uniref:Uncharacterized protein n=1 Tax=Evansella cellulosilytica (strain ATCC 21833 / DSM 2522 / FERM P-1141 / JCM 9156 / N-4) TaxID=649639 RepID=E6TZ36_EVAC2|nr:hypothetical protein [Evansella cellulosilytica]ADU32479.1 hypothetical protein Bcell_4252 [Evansella cellulosilytica DSM 2522]
MINIFLGLLFIFFKPNLSFLDIGIAYYITNIIGYISIFFGVKELARKYNGIVKVQPYVIFMMIHSIIFLLLNVSGNSPLTIEMSSYMAVISLIGLGFIIVGTFLVFIIISKLIEVLKVETSKTVSARKLELVCAAMMITFFLTGVSYFLFPLTPEIPQMMMGILLFLKVIFLFGFYNVFLRNRESIVEHY